MAASVQVRRFCEQSLSDRYALFCVPMTAALPAGMSYSDTMGPHAHIVTQGHCKFSRRICSWITFGSKIVRPDLFWQAKIDRVGSLFAQIKFCMTERHANMLTSAICLEKMSMESASRVAWFFLM